MQKLLSKLFALVILVTVNIHAQDTLAVPHMIGTDPVGALNATIVGDTTTTGAQAHSVYLLENDKIYLMNAVLMVDYDLNLVGEAPDPAVATSKPPVIQAAILTDGSNQGTFIEATSGNVTLKGLVFNGNTPDGLKRVGTVVKLMADYQKLVVDGCHVEGMSGNSFEPHADSMKVFITNTVVRGVNSGDIFSGSFNRTHWAAGQYDSMLVQNCTYINSSAYAWVNAKPSNYALWDHNTIANINGDLFFTPGMANTTISNNIFYNIQMFGQTSTELASGWWPFKDQPHSVIDLDTLSTDWAAYSGSNRNIHVNNNVYFNDAVVTDFMNDTLTVTVQNAAQTGDSTYQDTVFAGAWMNARTTALFASNSSMSESNNQSLDPMFTSLPNAFRDSLLAHSLDYREDRSTDGSVFWQHEADNNWAVVQYPMAEDLSYTNATALTASSTGGPVGDPRWQGNLSSKDDQEVLPKDFTLHHNYPNPFNPTTTIDYSLSSNEEVTLAIYNIRGELVKTLTSRFHQAGRYSAVWHGKNDLDEKVSSGIYIYSLYTPQGTISKRLVLLK